MIHATSQRRRAPRRGYALVFVILCATLFTLISGTLLNFVVQYRRQCRYEMLRTQAGWCAEAGLERAWFQLSRDPGYGGEVWVAEVEARANVRTARIEITVVDVGERSEKRQLNVRARYPSEGPDFAVRNKSMEVQIPISGE